MSDENSNDTQEEEGSSSMETLAGSRHRSTRFKVLMRETVHQLLDGGIEGPIRIPYSTREWDLAVLRNKDQVVWYRLEDDRLLVSMHTRGEVITEMNSLPLFEELFWIDFIVEVVTLTLDLPVAALEVPTQVLQIALENLPLRTDIIVQIPYCKRKQEQFEERLKEALAIKGHKTHGEGKILITYPLITRMEYLFHCKH